MQVKHLLTFAVLLVAGYAIGYSVAQIKYGPIIPAVAFVAAWYFYIDKTKDEKKSSWTQFVEFLVVALIGAFFVTWMGIG